MVFQEDPMVRTGNNGRSLKRPAGVERQCTSKPCSLTGSVVELLQMLLPVASAPAVRFAGGVTSAVFEYVPVLPAGTVPTTVTRTLEPVGNVAIVPVTALPTNPTVQPAAPPEGVHVVWVTVTGAATLSENVVPSALSAGTASAADPMIITSATKQFVVRGLPQRSLLARSARPH